MKRLAICLIGGSFVGACGNKPNRVTANDVGRALGARLHEAGIITSPPRCPSIEATKGTTFDCTLEVESMVYPIVGKVADVVDGKPQFEVEWKNGTNGVVLRQLVVPPLREELWKEYGVTADVVCKDALILLDDQHSVTCAFSPKLIDSKLTILFDDKGKRTGWVTEPVLLARKQMQADVLTEIKAKVGPTAEIKCGEKPVDVEPVIVRPEDGKVLCALTANENGKPTTGQVVINVGPDRKVTGWEMR